jgi:hypothetical protein
MSTPEIPAGAAAVALSGKYGAGRFALVNAADYPLVAPYRWRVQEIRQPGVQPLAYAVTSVRRPDGRESTLHMHKLITGWKLTDHVNHDGLDNRRWNLRPATVSQNLGNQRKTVGPTSSQYKGVSRGRAERKWQARICGSPLGYFASEADAARAYDAAAFARWGDFAWLNFPRRVSSLTPAQSDALAVIAMEDAQIMPPVNPVFRAMTLMTPARRAARQAAA